MQKFIIYQDNKLAIILAINRRNLIEKKLLYQYLLFYMKDRYNSREIGIKYLGTKEMIVELFTHQLQEAKFKNFKKQILNLIDY